MIRTLVAGLTISCLTGTLSLPVAGGVIFTGDFEGGSRAGFSEDIEGNGEYEIVAQPEPVRSGKHSCKYMLHRARRVELVPNNCTAPVDSERWYGFSIYVPADWSAAARRDEVVAQWHASPDLDEGEDWRSPPLAVRTKGTMWQVTCRWDSKHISDGNTAEGNEMLWSGAIDRGQWTDWVFHIKWSWKQDGIVEVWKNGQLLKRREGPNCYNDKGGLYFKWGIYHTEEDRTLYNDELRIADGTATYETVAPPGSRVPNVRPVRAAASRAAFEWEESLTAARKRARAEGRPVFIFFTETNKAARLVEMSTFDDDAVKKALAPLICVRVDPMQELALAETFGLKVALGIGMMDPDGGALSVKEGIPRPEGVLEVVEAGLGKFGPILTSSDIARLDRSIERARRFVEQKQYDRALRELSRVGGARWGPAREAQEIRAAIEQKAKEALGRAVEAEEGSPVKARSMFEQVKREFAGLPAADEAARHLDELAKRGVIDIKKVRMQANALYKKGLRLEELNRYAEAIELYKQIYSLPSTEFTRTATAAIERLENDPEVAKAIERADVEKEAQALLRQAQMWERNAQEQKAAELFRRVLEQFPDTTAADTAVEALRRLRR